MNKKKPNSTSPQRTHQGLASRAAIERAKRRKKTVDTMASVKSGLPEIKVGRFSPNERKEDSEHFMRYAAELREKIKQDKEVGRRLMLQVGYVDENGVLMPRRDI